MICVQELTKRFPDGFLAVDRLSLTVGPGEVFGLLGANGAGKTTTLRMILGLLEPTGGEVLINGLRVSAEPLRLKRQLGLVSASAGLYPWLTPREMMEYFGAGYGLNDQQIATRIEELTRVMQLERFLDQRCATLSTGQTQRVNLARALVHDPPVVLLDEPTRGLDVVGAQIVFEYVTHLRSLGKAIIVSTHKLEEAERLCDRFGLLHRGQLRHCGTIAQLRDQTGHLSLVEMFLAILAEDAYTAGPSPQAMQSTEASGAGEQL